MKRRIPAFISLFFLSMFDGNPIPANRIPDNPLQENRIPANPLEQKRVPNVNLDQNPPSDVVPSAPTPPPEQIEPGSEQEEQKPKQETQQSNQDEEFVPKYQIEPFQRLMD